MKRAGKGQRAATGKQPGTGSLAGTRTTAGTLAGAGGRQRRGSPTRWRLAILGLLALSLLPAVGCSADSGSGDSSIGSAPPAVAPGPASGAATAEAPTASNSTEATAGGPSHGPATTTARATLEETLHRAFDGGKPGTDQLRDALVAAGFAAADVQVTAGRTPTGLEADAVEIGVNQGGGCLVAQVRRGAVSVAVLPALADGRCLVGAAAP